VSSTAKVTVTASGSPDRSEISVTTVRFAMCAILACQLHPIPVYHFAMTRSTVRYDSRRDWELEP
ncbi:MAG: hypothetical protein B7X41_08600, partial [Microbacterium sp. 14-71-5]